MSDVLQLIHRLEGRPELQPLPGVTIRHYAGPADVEAWLDVRHAAFARQQVGVRRWTSRDFEVEILAKPWWRPERMWIAEVEQLPGVRQAIGTVTMALRTGQASEVPVVHWLAVRPIWRRRGIAQHLMSLLEQAAWDAGYREVRLETHQAWSEAVALYRSLGYVEV
ncbi:MAG: GNAT family N-acetyltransferase [Pirellulales bacterium]|nr:GNAT family N-acetyltransferase [Pirellulales bacterium]